MHFAFLQSEIFLISLFSFIFKRLKFYRLRFWAIFCMDNDMKFSNSLNTTPDRVPLINFLIILKQEILLKYRYRYILKNYCTFMIEV
jgi:hypothetical protein